MYYNIMFPSSQRQAPVAKGHNKEPQVSLELAAPWFQV